MQLNIEQRKLIQAKPADILDGDLVVIKQQFTADNRDIVAASIESENATLKRFMTMGNTMLLIPENENYEPIQIKNDQAKILGIYIQEKLLLM